MIRHATQPVRKFHLQWDFFKSLGVSLKNASVPNFDKEYLCDAGVTMPNQGLEGEPNGCTNFTTADVAIDLTQGAVIFHAEDLEAVTHANALGGLDTRLSLLAATPATPEHPERLGWIGGFFQIIADGLFDYFDAFRMAQISGAPEKRSISWVTPWFPSWEAAITGSIVIKNPDGSYTLMAGTKEQSIVMPMPTPLELDIVRRNPRAYNWHNHKLDGWHEKFGPLTYRDKSWQGPNIGDGGFVEFPREVVNVVMTIPGTAGFTCTRGLVTTPQPVDLNAVQWIVSFVRHKLGYTN